MTGQVKWDEGIVQGAIKAIRRADAQLANSKGTAETYGAAAGHQRLRDRLLASADSWRINRARVSEGLATLASNLEQMDQTLAEWDGRTAKQFQAAAESSSSAAQPAQDGAAGGGGPVPSVAAPQAAVGPQQPAAPAGPTLPNNIGPQVTDSAPDQPSNRDDTGSPPVDQVAPPLPLVPPEASDQQRVQLQVLLEEIARKWQDITGTPPDAILALLAIIGGATGPGRPGGDGVDPEPADWLVDIDPEDVVPSLPHDEPSESGAPSDVVGDRNADVSAPDEPASTGEGQSSDIPGTDLPAEASATDPPVPPATADQVDRSMTGPPPATVEEAMSSAIPLVDAPGSELPILEPPAAAAGPVSGGGGAAAETLPPLTTIEPVAGPSDPVVGLPNLDAPAGAAGAATVAAVGGLGSLAPTRTSEPHPTTGQAATGPLPLLSTPGTGGSMSGVRSGAGSGSGSATTTGLSGASGSTPSHSDEVAESEATQPASDEQAGESA